MFRVGGGWGDFYVIFLQEVEEHVKMAYTDEGKTNNRDGKVG